MRGRQHCPRFQLRPGNGGARRSFQRPCATPTPGRSCRRRAPTQCRGPWSCCRQGAPHCRAALLPAPLRSQHTQVAPVKRDEKTRRRCGLSGSAAALRRHTSHFGSRGDDALRFCTTHKEEGHSDLTHKPCERDGCHKRPNSGSPVSRVKRFCGAHKPEDHDNVTS
jgi:hypothetical protein